MGTAAQRWWAKIEIVGECWIWTGARTSNGYGNFTDRPRHQISAHRFGYELLVGCIPEGLTIDHLCRNHACVNPRHLEAVTQRINNLRGISGAAINARKTHCLRGHPLANAYIDPSGSRQCRICKNIRRGY